MDELDSWGAPPTKLFVEDRGNCISFEFANELSFADGKDKSIEYEGHTLNIDLGGGPEPEIFSVIPLPGWEVITDNWLVVKEGTRALITICQMGMS